MKPHLFLLAALVACDPGAREDMRDAGKAIERTGHEIGEAAKKTADQVDDRAEVAGDELSAQLDDARGKLKEARAVADRAGDLYMDRATVDADEIRCAAEAYAVDRAMVQKAIENPRTLAGTSSFEPVAGKGYRITQVDPDSAVAKLDVRVGDIVIAVDGTRVEALDGENVVRRLQQASEVEFTVERNGQDVVKTVEIES